MKKMALLLLVFLFLSSLTVAQFEDRITKLPTEELTSFLTPLATWTGTYFNSGGYYSASVAKTFGFKFSLIGMMIFVPDDQTTFSLADGSESATFFGDKGAAVPGTNGFVVYPPGVNKTSIPGGIPQIAASTMGTEVMLRFLPKISVDEIDVGLFGIGVKHSISQYIPLSPIDIAVQFMYNRFSIESPEIDLSTSNIAFNAHASKSLGLLILYGGLQYESSSLDIDYTFAGTGFQGVFDGDKLNVSMDGDNSFRLTVGAALKLAILVINADYNIGSQGVFVAGINLEF